MKIDLQALTKRTATPLPDEYRRMTKHELISEIRRLRMRLHSLRIEISTLKGRNRNA
jgi:hypothetical protein